MYANKYNEKNMAEKKKRKEIKKIIIYIKY
jgi:hypothetical protein